MATSYVPRTFSGVFIFNLATSILNPFAYVTGTSAKKNDEMIINVIVIVARAQPRTPSRRDDVRRATPSSSRLIARPIVIARRGVRVVLSLAAASPCVVDVGSCSCEREREPLRTRSLDANRLDDAAHTANGDGAAPRLARTPHG